ncbi:hypothetical protein DFH08DRAFT_826543 [Mycena albidolilacea]|uniref:Uncharacterized protein n=1 Tax=Mycena albidolilacea TaxID=1033008 RepID=A0AAD6Z043_9AGAR|nr:hypothetical protein DFH08DRAFT_826543 [Mycena albidolilacea]
MLQLGVLGQRPPNSLWDLGTLYAYSEFVHDSCVGMYTLYTIRRSVYGRIRIPFKRVNPFRTRPFSKQAEQLYGRDGNRRDGPSTRRRRERIGALFVEDPALFAVFRLRAEVPRCQNDSGGGLPKKVKGRMRNVLSGPILNEPE